MGGSWSFPGWSAWAEVNSAGTGLRRREFGERCRRPIEVLAHIGI